MQATMNIRVWLLIVSRPNNGSAQDCEYAEDGQCVECLENPARPMGMRHQVLRPMDVNDRISVLDRVGKAQELNVGSLGS